MSYPGYLRLFETGELQNRVDRLYEIAESCTLCPHKCGIDRRRVADGTCESRLAPIVSSWGPHFGEERPLVGKHGSGTIFLTNCNLKCVFCQNYDISQMGNGKEIDCDELANIMLSLQRRGCHNINFVTPTHMVPAISRALIAAVPKGLSVPLIYNSGGYDDVETLKLLDGIFDIYMPDFKYADEEIAEKLSAAPDYPGIAAAALREMHRQVGDLETDTFGVAKRGLLVRHLVLPDSLAGSKKVIDFIASLSKNTYLNLMDQYRPVFRAKRHEGLGRHVTFQEFDETVAYARRTGIRRLD